MQIDNDLLQGFFSKNGIIDIMQIIMLETIHKKGFF